MDYDFSSLTDYSYLRKKQELRFECAVGVEGRLGNIRSALLRDLSPVPLLPAHERTMVVAGYAPSLRGKADQIAGEHGDLFSVSGAHDYLIGLHVIPRAHVECDPRPHKAKLLTKPDERVTYMLASCCAPEVFDAVAGHDVALWHSAQSKVEDAEVARLSPEAFLVCGGTTVGSRAVALGSALGYRAYVLYAFDCSFEDNQHAGEHPNDVPASEVMRVKICDREFNTTAQLLRAAQDFLWQVGQMQDCTFTLVGDGLLQHAVKTMRVPRCEVIE